MWLLYMHVSILLQLLHWMMLKSMPVILLPQCVASSADVIWRNLMWQL
jgi:hypothetical protein